MGITDFFSDLLSSVSFVQDVQAEAPADDKEDSEEEGGDDKEDKKEEGGEGDDGGDDGEGGGDGGDGGDGDEGEEGEEKEEGGDDDEEDEEEEEEEEEEPVDPKPRLEEECAKSAQCQGYKHHFDECVERVTQQQEDPEYKGPKENCVEEFFHLQHCATQCAAPKLFKQLK
ncbi:ubiquinol-cytochrome c reductase subunit 6 [Cladophialophora yegresii CBS 114405]|uniref:Cytochrome b-c1 complex subunit 6, mitochondrial n=1 Tax=Cladophialophora yegresii CBS 114405 TaxID=1182544 RepID=W9VMM4_9EURO|nr:ubiquinol-cytochrome c reductase subunit 6 [Cladophialophora yegresii CBS 114405]EXJ54270.1 ubiquinol-cytochrome c reductase subunit 6 [Cladophialophora yegresii CBS 114405]